MPKNAIEPTPKFDCHLSKRANRVTSLLSYRAFEHTQVNHALAFSNTTFLLFNLICVIMTIFSNIFLSLLSKKSKHDPGMFAPMQLFPFSTEAKMEGQPL